MRILLHIGQSKTGTSAIQAYMTLNRAKLGEQGVLYPTVTVAGMKVDVGNHNSIADSLSGLVRFPYMTAEQHFRHVFDEAERSGASRIVFSGEHFFGGEPRIWDVPDHDAFFATYRRKVEALAPYLRGHETKVLLYLRPQAHWLCSAIGQTVRIEGLISDRQIYESDRQFFELAKPVLRYATLLNIWRETIDAATIEVVPYDRTMLRGGNVIPDFLERSGLQGLKLPYAALDIEVNQSLTRECLEIKKLFNRQRHSKSVERVAIRCLEQMSRERGGDKIYRLSADLLAEIQLFVRPENAAVEQHFGVPAEILNRAPAPISGGPVSADEFENAYAALEQRLRSPRVRLMIADDIMRALLRKHARPVHSLLHQFKMGHLRRLYQQ